MAAARGNRTGRASQGSRARENGRRDPGESFQKATLASLLPLLRPGPLEEQRFGKAAPRGGGPVEVFFVAKGAPCTEFRHPGVCGVT